MELLSHTHTHTRPRLTALMFERFGCQAVAVAPAPELAAYGSGEHSGLLVDLGEHAVQALALYDGTVLLHQQERVACLGAKHATAVARRLLDGAAEQVGVFPVYKSTLY